MDGEYMMYILMKLQKLDYLYMMLPIGGNLKCLKYLVFGWYLLYGFIYRQMATMKRYKIYCLFDDYGYY